MYFAVPSTQSSCGGLMCRDTATEQLHGRKHHQQQIKRCQKWSWRRRRSQTIDKILDCIDSLQAKESDFAQDDTATIAH